MAINLSKISNALNWPKPKTLKDVQAFLGLTGYYHRFHQGYGLIAQPLTQLLKKDNQGRLNWNEATQLAFSTLKQALVSSPVLATQDFRKEFVIECDASGMGIGAILMQEKRPIAYFSKALSSKNWSKSAYEREIMSLVLAVQHWSPYLLGRKFTIFTDQCSLKHLLEQQIATPAQQKWGAKLLGYNFKIIYKPGKSNAAADALSREAELKIAAITLPYWVDWEQIEKELQEDSSLQKKLFRTCKKMLLRIHITLGFRTYYIIKADW